MKISRRARIERTIAIILQYYRVPGVTADWLEEGEIPWPPR